VNKFYASSPVVMIEAEDYFDVVVYIYTPPKLRGQGLMRKLWEEEVLPAVTRNLFLIFQPDEGTDPARLRKFYEGLGFHFDEEGAVAIREFET